MNIQINKVYDIRIPENKRTSNGFVISKLKKVKLLSIVNKVNYRGSKICKIKVELVEGDLYRIAGRDGGTTDTWVGHLYKSYNTKTNTHRVIFEIYSNILDTNNTSDSLNKNNITNFFCLINGPYF